MDAIYFSAWFGDIEKKVELSKPAYGAEGYFILIDKIYYGTMLKRGGKWQAHLNPAAWTQLTSDDVRILAEILEDHNR